ncbi:histone deacetylase family protein [Chitinasiproducens palmae]|uniref:Acetoin utilization deacetylase AcuC n=1 Tax=Chitinasiproducens palmae TaxID=1770053 RepID=A0A1H2PVU2_9BURK|nr:histone deacetylase family protein [Chitinasiproducens palmae]SDV51081.1 Acetoin utilization deacetylase AcuC [Chitinasiproducens palmae]
MSTAFYTHADCQRHEMGDWHPECPARLQAIDDQLIASRIDMVLERVDAPMIDEGELARVHLPAYIDELRHRRPEHGYVDLDSDTRLNPFTWQAALRAAGAAVAATDAVLAGEYDNAFCSVRPPGHHAEPDRAMGFCFFNNVALAARHALDVHGLSRVAIVDFDVHHGNGTEMAFANEPRVLMCGLFQHPFYPFSGDPPLGANMANTPLPARTDGAQMRDIASRTWLPRLDAFAPELVLISAGFDAHIEDDMGNLALREADYAWLTARIMAIAARHANGRIVSCLEGGYNLSALGRSVVAHLRELAQV